MKDLPVPSFTTIGTLCWILEMSHTSWKNFKCVPFISKRVSLSSFKLNHKFQTCHSVFPFSPHQTKQRIQATSSSHPSSYSFWDLWHWRYVVTTEEIALSDIGVIPLHFSNKGCICFMRIAPLQYRELLWSITLNQEIIWHVYFLNRKCSVRSAGNPEICTC